MLTYQTFPQKKALTGTFTIPGDKSISHRALLLSAIAQGDTYITGLSDALDVINTRRALEQMSISIVDQNAETILVKGQGLYGLKKSADPIDLGNSGTAMRLLTGILANQTFSSVLIGDASLSKRPMRRIVDPLCQFGAQIQTSNAGTAPLYIEPRTNSLKAIEYELPIASAQVKSCLLLAALYAQNPSTIREKIATRDHTERLFHALGIPLYQKGPDLQVTPSAFKAIPEIMIPGDISSAAFFIAAATLIPGSDLTLENIGINPLRMGFIKTLKKMGAAIEVIPHLNNIGEPIANIRVRSATLQGITVSSEDVVNMIDEFPIFFVIAACSAGTTTVRNVEELRHKESDRLSVMAQSLKQLGIIVEEFADGIAIQGGRFIGGMVDSHGDHRIAMALTIAGSCAQDTLFITDCDNVATSFPQFVEMAQNMGMQMIMKETEV
jgi:3-phosphoshikimate 1-carboxyvinyltransferase